MKYVYLNSAGQIIAIHESQVSLSLYEDAGVTRLVILPPEFVRYRIENGSAVAFLVEGWEAAEIHENG